MSRYSPSRALRKQRREGGITSTNYYVLAVPQDADCSPRMKVQSYPLLNHIM